MQKKISEQEILSIFDTLKKRIGEHERLHGGSIWDKLADKAIDKGFEIAEKKLFGGGIIDKIGDRVLDKAVDVGFNMLSKKLGLGVGGKIGGKETIPPFLRKEILKGAKEHAKGQGFDDATVRPIMKEIGTYLNPLTLVELMGGGLGGAMGGGIEDANPLLWGYMLGHDVIGPAIFGRGGRDKTLTKMGNDIMNLFSGKYKKVGDVGGDRPEYHHSSQAIFPESNIPRVGDRESSKVRPSGRGTKGDESYKISQFFHSDLPNAFKGIGVKKGRGRPKKEPMDAIHIDIDSHNQSRNKGKVGNGFKKGSQEAKEHMAKIRAMRGKNKGIGLYA